MEKLMIAMSGGVDSSVAACLMKNAGKDCIGVTAQLQDDAATQISDAKAVCQKLDMDFAVADMREAFRTTVQAYFVSSYEAGLTPNPCIRCNTHIKFGLLWQKARGFGCTHLVTGHYARIVYENGRHLLKKASDSAKDQSYFLYGIPRQLLIHIYFPLGALSKSQVRSIAQESGLLNARKKDSQDICFVPDGDYMRFLKEFTGKDYHPGAYLDLAGNQVGTHQGAVAYTLGQRKGLGIALGAPVYVCAKDMDANTVTVGPDEALYRKALLAKDWNWLSVDGVAQPLRCKAKARSRMAEQPATVYPEENGFFRVIFDEPQRAITPGQSVVLYDGDTVIGGGTIDRVE